MRLGKTPELEQSESGETLGFIFQRSGHDQVLWHVHREGPDRHITEKRCSEVSAGNPERVLVCIWLLKNGNE
jgi:hypothetical protein